jgi:hypothetical protein
MTTTFAEGTKTIHEADPHFIATQQSDGEADAPYSGLPFYIECRRNVGGVATTSIIDSDPTIKGAINNNDKDAPVNAPQLEFAD